MKNILNKLLKQENLTYSETKEVMNNIMEGKLNNSQIASFLTALRIKGETVDEITACAEIMREKAFSIKPNVENYVDTCGTGGDGTNSFNISTITAFVTAGADVPVAKHGNRSVSSKSGSADVMKELGINIDIKPDKVKECIEKIGIGFLFAPSFHKAMKFAMPVRRELGIRTIFNVLGPLTNPANAKAQLMGVFAVNLTETLANVLKNLGLKHAMVVHGSGLDEIAIHNETQISELKNGKVMTYKIKPEEFGIKTSSISSIKGGKPKENAEIIMNILNGERSPKRDIVILNSGAAIYVSGKAETFHKGIKLAEKSIDSKNALKKLEELKEFTNK